MSESGSFRPQCAVNHESRSRAYSIGVRVCESGSSRRECLPYAALLFGSSLAFYLNRHCRMELTSGAPHDTPFSAKQ